MKKVLALALAAVMVIGMMSIASAATVSITRDDTWDENADSANATYTPYKIFDAVITGEGDDTVAVYTVDSEAKANALPSIFKSELASDGKYYVTLVDSSTTAATIVAELKTMVEDPANAELFPAGTPVTSGNNPVEVGVADNSYTLIIASNGKNLAVQTVGTATVTIAEKNDYPTISKEQKKAADPTYTEAEIPAEIGTYIDYRVTVHVPADANQPIYVYDKMSAGLTWDDKYDGNENTAGAGLVLSPAKTYSFIADGQDGYDSSATWQIVFDTDTVIASRNSDIVITYRALVTEAALTDTGRENEVTLKYDNNNYILKDKVEYTTYFGGIEKVDGANSTVKLENVKFEVTVGGAAFPVKLVEVSGGQNYYVPDPTGSSNEILTGANGLVIIRGLDNAKTYTLTETETNAGYNLLPTTKDLTLAEDTGDAYTTATYDKVENNKGAVLPATGGIGTTIFYVSGLIMVLGASIILVSRRRADAK